MYATTTRSRYVHLLRDSAPGPTGNGGTGIRLRYECGAEAFVFPYGAVRQTGTGMRGHMVLKFRTMPEGATACPKCAAKDASMAAAERAPRREQVAA